jgi:hypothetical protein
MAIVMIAATTLTAAHGPGCAAPPPGRRGFDRQRMDGMRAQMEAMRALDIETRWAVLGLGLELAPAKIDSLRAPFVEAWTHRASILGQSDGDRNWDAIRDEFEDMRDALDARIQAVLDEDELAAFRDAMKALDRRRPRMP